MATPTEWERRELNKKLWKHGREATRRLHERRVAAWAAADDGEFPAYADSERIVGEEIGLLVRALGGIAHLSDDDLGAW